MTVTTQTINRLKRELGGSFLLVSQPDHPMLLTGPDLLIGGEGKLTSVLFITKTESDKSLIARIMSIRLAMPSNTKVLAVLSDGAKLSTQVTDSLDEIISAENSWRMIAHYATSDAMSKVDKNALLKSKKIHSEKYAFAMLLATLRRKHVLAKVEPRSVINELANNPDDIRIHNANKTIQKRSSTNVKGTHVTSLTSSSRPIQQLRTICGAGLVDSYVLDTGVPYQRLDSNLNILLIENWPTVRHDPEKPMRSAAFGCWIMASSSGANDIYNLIERSRDPKYVQRWLHA